MKKIMNRIIVFNNCENCPFFDNQYYEFDRFCVRLDRIIEKNDKGIYEIPLECPLETTEKDVNLF